MKILTLTFNCCACFVCYEDDILWGAGFHVAVKVAA